ncbi:hypothetical protein [Micromonospora tarapacensis]|nr:hypothetical protein [Micromonospora tarapacensis]
MTIDVIAAMNYLAQARVVYRAIEPGVDRVEFSLQQAISATNFY